MVLPAGLVLLRAAVVVDGERRVPAGPRGPRRRGRSRTCRSRCPTSSTGPCGSRSRATRCSSSPSSSGMKPLAARACASRSAGIPGVSGTAATLAAARFGDMTARTCPRCAGPLTTGLETDQGDGARRRRPWARLLRAGSRSPAPPAAGRRLRTCRARSAATTAAAEASDRPVRRHRAGSCAGHPVGAPGVPVPVQVAVDRRAPRGRERIEGKTSKACWAPGSSAYTTVRFEISRSRATKSRACSTATSVSRTPCSTKKSGASGVIRSSGVAASKTSGSSRPARLHDPRRQEAVAHQLGAGAARCRRRSRRRRSAGPPTCTEVSASSKPGWYSGSFGCQRGQRGQVAARGAAGDRDVRRVAAVLLDVLPDPGDRPLHVDDVRRQGVARREPVVDRHADPALGGQVLHQRDALAAPCCRASSRRRAPAAARARRRRSPSAGR